MNFRIIPYLADQAGILLVSYAVPLHPACKPSADSPDAWWATRVHRRKEVLPPKPEVANR